MKSGLCVLVLIAVGIYLQPKEELQTNRKCEPSFFVASIREKINPTKFWQLQEKALRKEIKILSGTHPGQIKYQKDMSEALEKARLSLERLREEHEILSVKNFEALLGIKTSLGQFFSIVPPV